MRVASSFLLFALLPLIDCGSESDLLIGIVPLSEAGTASTTAGTGAAPTTGGSEAVAGVGGSGAVSGSSEGGSSSNAAGAAGAAGDTGEPCVAGELPPDGSLVHRYSFDGTGTKAIDSIAGFDGDIINAALDGSHALTLNGDSAQFVDLPDHIISMLPDVTVVVWTAWVDGAAYGRVFDFGMNDQGIDKTGMGNSYMAVLPKTGFFNQTKSGLGGEIKVPGFPTVTLGSTISMVHRAAQVALALQGGVRATLYLDGDELASQPTAITPAKIDDRNNWLGKSQYTGNPGYDGSFEEVRIYNVALSSCQLHALLVRGPESL
jgi:hypothetical protein